MREHWCYGCEKLADFAQENQVDLTIIGMDDPLVGGVVDVFESRDCAYSTPQKCSNPGRLQGIFKDLMKKYNIQQPHMRTLTIRKKHWHIFAQKPNS